MERHTPGLIFYDQAEMGHGRIQKQKQAFSTSPEQAPSQCLRYHDKLHYDMARTQLDLERQRALLLLKEEAERRIQELKMRYSLCRQLLGSIVYGDSMGNLLLAITTPDDEKIISRRLLNVRGYQAKIYVSLGGERMALEVSWGESKENNVYFSDVQHGILPKKFLDKLKSKGMVFLVSERAEKKAAEALLAYSFYSAPTVELPFTYGWGRNSAGRWHFAKENELTFKEVEKNA